MWLKCLETRDLKKILSFLFIGICLSFFQIAYSEQPDDAREVLQADKQRLPDPMNLVPGWWDYFDVKIPLLEKRVNALEARLNNLAGQLDDPEQKENAESLIKRISANFSLYSKLQGKRLEAFDDSWIPKEKYKFSEFLSLAEKTRSSSLLVDTEKRSLAWQKIFVENLRQDLSNLYAFYLKEDNFTYNKFIHGLEVIKNRSRLAYLEKEIKLRESFINLNSEQHDRYKDELGIASERIDYATIDISNISKEKEDLRKKLLNLEKELIKVESSRLTEDGELGISRSKELISNLVLMDLLINEAYLKSQIHFFDSLIVLYKVKVTHEYDEGNINQFLHEWDLFLATLQEQMDYWRESLGIEGDLLCKSLISKTEKNPNDQEGGLTEKDTSYCFEKVVDVNLSLEKLLLSSFRLELLSDLIQKQILESQTVGEQIEFHYQKQVIAFMDKLNKFANFSLFEIGGVPITLMGLLQALFVFVIAVLISKIIQKIIRFASRQKKRRLAEPTLYILNRIVHYTILVFAAFIALSTMGLTLGNLALILGALGIGVGFGLQNIVNNFLSGLSVLFGRNIKVGDYVELEEGQFGQVKEINVQHTTIHTFDGTDIVVPNSLIMGNKLINWTKQDPFQRLHVPFCVAYGTDQNLVRSIAVEAAEKVPCTIKNNPKIPDPDVWLVRFGDSSLDFELIVWVNVHVSTGRTSMKAAYLSQIEFALKEHGVVIPFPQRDLHLKTVSEEFLKLTNAGKTSRKEI